MPEPRVDQKLWQHVQADQKERPSQTEDLQEKLSERQPTWAKTAQMLLLNAPMELP